MLLRSFSPLFSAGMLLFGLVGSAVAEEASLWIEELDLSTMKQGHKEPVAGTNFYGGPISIGGQEYGHGVASHAFSEFIIDLKGVATRFHGFGGIDDVTKGKGSVVFEIYVDNELAVQTPLITGGMEAYEFDIDLTSASQMVLNVTTNADNGALDYCDWADAKIVYDTSSGKKPESMVLESTDEGIYIGPEPDFPAIRGPLRVGTTPGREFIFRVPSTGKSPKVYNAFQLPEGLKLDPASGIIRGEIGEEGRYEVTLEVSNEDGITSRPLVITAGEHKLAMTPPMGWNAWNVWACMISVDRARDAAYGMLQSGLADVGYSYINIDDGWQGARDESGVLQPKEGFGDYKELTRDVHAIGLKVGLYSSPGPKTCCLFKGSYEHELLDAQTWADWGIDYLKYDYCYYRDVAPKNPSIEDYKKPYEVMRGALDQVDRDIVFSFCQYGMGKVWEWGEGVGGNMWRTTGDIRDTWSHLRHIGFSQLTQAPFAGPGHWNDADMLIIGRLGWGEGLRPTRLLEQEQATQMTMWSILAAPLLLGCELNNMDDFTKAIAANPEVIAVNQDPLGQQGTRIVKEELRPVEIWSRPLCDGTKAVALFNRGALECEVTISWEKLGLEGDQPVRDLWRRQDMGVFTGEYTATVVPHGAVMVKIGTLGELQIP